MGGIESSISLVIESNIHQPGESCGHRIPVVPWKKWTHFGWTSVAVELVSIERGRRSFCSLQLVRRRSRIACPTRMNTRTNSSKLSIYGHVHNHKTLAVHSHLWPVFIADPFNMFSSERRGGNEFPIFAMATDTKRIAVLCRHKCYL